MYTYDMHQGEESMRLIFIAIVVVFSLLAIGAWRLSVEMARRRTAEYASLSGSLGFDSPADPQAIAALQRHMAKLWPFTQGRRHRIKDSMAGDRDGLHWTIFDFRFTTGSGKHTHHHEGTAIAVQVPEILFGRLPTLSLTSKTFMSRLSRWLGFSKNVIDVEALRDRYVVNGVESAEAHRVLNPRTIDFLLSTPAVRRWQMSGDLVVLAREGAFSGAEIGEAMSEVSALVECLHVSR